MGTNNYSCTTQHSIHSSSCIVPMFTDLRTLSIWYQYVFLNCVIVYQYDFLYHITRYKCVLLNCTTGYNSYTWNELLGTNFSFWTHYYIIPNCLLVLSQWSGFIAWTKICLKSLKENVSRADFFKKWTNSFVLLKSSSHTNLSIWTESKGIKLFLTAPLDNDLS